MKVGFYGGWFDELPGAPCVEQLLLNGKHAIEAGQAQWLARKVLFAEVGNQIESNAAETYEVVRAAMLVES